MISLATADINLKTWWYLSDCLLKKRLGRGYYVDKLEEMASDYFSSKYAIAVCNGTLADMVMLMTLKEMYPEKKEVILPALTFVAHANAVVLAGLVPKFVDVNYDFLMDWGNVRPNLLNTLCVFPVHLLGKFAGMPIFPDVPTLEDCCEAMGGDHCGKKFGTFGIAGSFSMFPSHTVTTGEGGLIITDSPEFNAIARSIINHGKWRSNDFTFNFVGVNAKMTNLQAAVGCSVFKSIDSVNERRQRNVALYNKHLGLSFKTDAPHCYPVIYSSPEDRDKSLDFLKANCIEARKLMGCIPEYHFFQTLYPDMGEFPVASFLANNGLFLPIHQNLKEHEIKYICEIVNETRR
jgi:perosamine synthetase